MLSACAADSPTQVDTLVSDAPVAYATGGNGPGVGTTKTAPGNGDNFEAYEDRFRHVREYTDGGETILRECQLNVVEDQDGTDWFNTKVGKTHISEINAYVMIHERRGGVWTPTHIGRAAWNFQRFSGDFGEISWNSRAQGLVAPLDPTLDAAFISDVAANLDPTDISGWPHDLRNVPLFPGGSGDPMITAILGRADDNGQLEGVTCDVQVHHPAFGGLLDIRRHDIEVGGGFPDKFKKWLP